MQGKEQDARYMVTMTYPDGQCDFCLHSHLYLLINLFYCTRLTEWAKKIQHWKKKLDIVIIV